MFSVAVVLFAILGTMHLINYSRVVQNADQVLDILVENDGMFPQKSLKKEEKEKRHRKQPGISEETPYESRYFTVWLEENGEVVQTNLGKIAAVDEETAEEYAKKVKESSEPRGFLKNYRYDMQEKEGKIFIVFLDCERSLSNFRSVIGISVGASLMGMVAVFLLVIWLSGKVVRPFAENYEKQKRFITDAGHEIKTPLTIMDADAEIIKMEIGENEWVEDLQKQIVRLKDLTEDLIYLSKMEEKQKILSKIEFPISEVAMEMVQSFQSLAKVQGKTFYCEIEPMVSYVGEMKTIQRLCSILLDNALKYSKDGGKISFLLYKKNKNVHIIVENTTEKIEPEEINHLFERFYRRDPSRNSQTGGHGIGLSIAKAIVAAHKGKIIASSSDGMSLRIHVIL